MGKNNTKRGCITAIATMLMVMLTVLPLNTIGLFIRPICKELQITTAQLSLCFSLNAIGAVATSFFFGRLYKRFGKKPLIVVGGITVFLYLFSMSVSSNLFLIYVTAAVAGIGGTTSGFAMGQLTMTEWFDKARATMYSSLTITLSLFVALLSPIIASGILNFGYRLVLLVEAFISGGGIVLLGLFAVSKSPEKYGMRPIGYLSAHHKMEPIGASLTMAQIRKTLPFWIALLISLMTCTVGRVASTHGNNFFQTLGLSSTQASYVSSVNAIATLVWSVLFGVLSDKFSPKIAAVSSGCFAAAVMLMNPLLAGMSGALLYAIFVEAESGIASIYSPAVVAKVYGKQEAAQMIGLIRCFASIGSIMGPVFAGILYDRFGNYSFCLFVTGTLMIFVVVLCIVLDNKKVWKI
ncbi:MFS transporter [Lactonifactor longoviformis]|uniref:Sugar phosphate permease n=1 Tax=Lactonifactor longoviformis DSM 17459 TaxID=1122155 RepID=A0A1M4ZYG1_9CLOT|nr:MFS transporter [Lactonifactor longoviformis]POP31736.1 MFS transporter [Lactonifactor longoviformis]SHF22666.1 Sugar phosphate permease [Lactonifactor longoviformis DSM 17459]